jgi:hypothetical protein
MLHILRRTLMEPNTMPVVRINDATFANLSILKTWHGIKTPSETIDLLVIEAMEQLGIERDDEPESVFSATDEEIIHFDTTPGLSYTKPLSASINNKALPNPNWLAILITTIKAVKVKGVKNDNLVQELSIPAKAGSYEADGFKYHPDLGISVQGQSASACWKEVDRLAKKWRIPVSVKFQWRQNPKAQYPGKTGMLHSGN